MQIHVCTVYIMKWGEMSVWGDVDGGRCWGGEMSWGEDVEGGDDMGGDVMDSYRQFASDVRRWTDGRMDGPCADL